MERIVRTMGRCVLLVAGCLCWIGLIPRAGFAYRPFATEDAGVAGKGVFQLESSLDYLDWRAGDAEFVLLLVPVYGVTRSLELSLETPYMIHRSGSGADHRGLGDATVVGKLLLLGGGDAHASVALKGAVKTASGDVSVGLGTGAVDYTLAAAFSNNVGGASSHAMLAYSVVGDEGDQGARDVYSYGIATGTPLGKATHLVLEVAGNRHPDRGAKQDPVAALVGMTRSVTDWLTLDAASRIGLTSSAEAWSLSIGMSLTISGEN